MSTPIFNYDDVVEVSPAVANGSLCGKRAWIVGIFEEPRRGVFFERFPSGVVYSVEFEDGSSVEVHESELTAVG